MPIWNIDDIAAQPELSLVRWRIYETEKLERRFVGYCPTNREGRVSSAIKTFDAATLRGVTRSGRTYELLGTPDFDADAQYVWNRWQDINRVQSCRDVTDEVHASTQAFGPRESANHG